MTLDYKNPNDWGRSPLTDRALRLQQIKAENPKQWAAMIEADIEALSMSVNAEGTEFRDTLAHTQLGVQPGYAQNRTRCKFLLQSVFY